MPFSNKTRKNTYNSHEKTALLKVDQCNACRIVSPSLITKKGLDDTVDIDIKVGDISNLLLNYKPFIK